MLKRVLRSILAFFDILEQPRTRMATERADNSESSNLEVNEDGLHEKKMIRFEIPNTPFHIMGTFADGFALTIGMNRLSPLLPSEVAVINWLEENRWNVMMTCMIMVMDKTNKIGEAVNKSINNL